MSITPKQEKRFWEKVAIGKEEECWLWTGAASGYGYGGYKIGSQKDNSRRNEFSHRVAFTISCGEIPRGMVVMHSCDVKRCCNPRHLILGTHSENHRDAWAKNLRRGPKLSRSQAERIRATEGNQRDIARRFGVSFQAVSLIKLGKRWVDRPALQVGWK